MGFRACQCLHDAHCGLVSHNPHRNNPPSLVCVRRLGGGFGGLHSRRPHGKSPARPPPLLGLVGDLWSSARLEGWEKDGRVFRPPNQCGSTSALWTMCDQKGNPRRPISPHHRHVVRLVSTHDNAWLHCFLFINLSTLAKMECAPEIWPSASSTLDAWPLSLSAPGVASNDQAHFDGSLVSGHHGVSETGENTWVAHDQDAPAGDGGIAPSTPPTPPCGGLSQTGAHQMARPSLPCACKPREIVLLGVFIASHHQLILACLATVLK